MRRAECGGRFGRSTPAYDASLLRAKILDVDVNFYTLRHTFASHYVMRGGSLVQLQAILGHVSIRMTQVYTHLAPDHLCGATAILEGLGTSEINARSTHEAVTPEAGVSAWYNYASLQGTAAYPSG
jgi:integrase